MTGDPSQAPLSDDQAESTKVPSRLLWFLLGLATGLILVGSVAGTAIMFTAARIGMSLASVSADDGMISGPDEPDVRGSLDTTGDLVSKGAQSGTIEGWSTGEMGWMGGEDTDSFESGEFTVATQLKDGLVHTVEVSVDKQTKMLQHGQPYSMARFLDRGTDAKVRVDYEIRSGEIYGTRVEIVNGDTPEWVYY